MLQETQKQKIRERLALYVQRFPSANMAATSLKGTSAATVSNILNGKFDKISDEMFLRIESHTAILTIVAAATIFTGVSLLIFVDGQGSYLGLVHYFIGLLLSLFSIGHLIKRIKILRKLIKK